MFTKEDCSKNLQIENRSSSCQRWSLHGFQTSHFICYRFGSVQILVAIDSELRLTSFPSFCAQPSEVTALFDWNLSRRPFLRQVVNTDLLLCTGSIRNMRFCSCVIFLLRDEWMIERLSEAMGAAWSATTSRWFHENFIPHEDKKWLVAAQNLQSIKPYWLLNWISIARVVACFLQASLSRLPPTRKRPVFVLAHQTRASRARERPQELSRWFCPLNLRLPSGTASERLPFDWQGLDLGLKLELCRLTNEL